MPYLSFFLWRFALRFFLRLWVRILRRFRFLPEAIPVFQKGSGRVLSEVFL